MKPRPSPVTTKKWNPSLPPKSTLHIELWEGPALALAYFGEVPVEYQLGEVTTGHAYAGLGYALIVSIDNTKHGRLLHFSVSCLDELPPWEIIACIKRALFPADVAAVMHLPEEASYVNLHPTTLHVWQLPVQWDVG